MESTSFAFLCLQLLKRQNSLWMDQFINVGIADTTVQQNSWTSDIFMTTFWLLLQRYVFENVYHSKFQNMVKLYIQERIR